MRRFLPATGSALVLATVARAATVHVPADQPTIQAGIDAAAAGDTVLVACGGYLEHDITLKSDVVLRSATGSADCVTVDAQGLGRVLWGDQLSAATEVTGFTITGGDATGPFPEIHGGGMKITVSSPRITNCVFKLNAAMHGGGAAVLHSSSPVLENCVFRDTVAGASLYVLNKSTPTLTGCLFVGRRVSSICPLTVVTLESCTLVDCELRANFGGAMSLSQCIVWNPPSCLMSSAITANCSLIPPGCYSQGSGNIFLDPLFCDPVNGSYYLQWGSPALAENTDGCGLMGAFGAGGCNSVGLRPVSWGSLKGRYRGAP